MRVLGGRYELVALVGRGGMGEVWEGRDRVIERRVAVKLLPHDRHDASGAELFFREAKTAGGLNHAGVVTVFDLGQDPDDGTLYLVMEFLAGRDLDTVLRRDGPPAVATAVEWAAQTAEALEVAHAAGVVHRDLKPANLMLGTDSRVKILDFGTARYMASTNRSSKVIGTLAYMPPERFGELPGDARSDLYSLGCVLHELLTGHTPFRAGDMIAMMAAHLHTPPVPPGNTRHGVPAALDDLVLALLAKDPDHRPASAAEVRHRLRELPTTAAYSPGAGTNRAPLVDADTPAAAMGGTTVLGDLTPHQASTATDQVPKRIPGPTADPPPPPRRITRRTALWLGVGAVAAAGAGTAAALALPDRDNPDPRVRWRHGTDGKLSRSPAVAGGTVFIGGSDKLYALDAATGHRKWASAGDAVEVLPAVADGMVYVCRYDKVQALDTSTGAGKWTFTADRSIDSSAAVVAGGVVYVAVRGTVYAIEATTGTRKWVVSTGDTSFGSPTPTVADGVVYLASYPNVYALDAATGTGKWSAPVPGSNWSTIADGVVYIGAGNTVCALDAATGAQKWASATDGSVGKSVAVATAGRVFVGSCGPGCRLYALDATTGTKAWTFDTGNEITTPAVADGVVYIGGGKVYALDAATGAMRWTFDGADGSPVVADGVVYVSGGVNVYALNTTTGNDSP
ncbi:PQQ-binding-like beta-propeller repeat protein [Embleya sp. NPDC050493]|uniref:serine/threonine-protein kinase n=1 Tax=Embleya sp. NPDC050493 TaxID=3363989 RepID=UPI0037A4A21C